MEPDKICRNLALSGHKWLAAIRGVQFVSDVVPSSDGNCPERQRRPTKKNMSSELAQQNHPSSRLSNGQKRSLTVPEETKYVWHILFKEGRMCIDESLCSAIPLNDQNAWYYPSQGHDDSEDELLDVGTKGGNWGKKTSRGSRWVRRGKIVPWGPGMDEWEVQQLFCSYESLR